MFMNLRFVSYLTLACALVASAHLEAAPANWAVTLTQSSISGQAGTTLIFGGTITNNSGTDLLFDSASIDFVTTAPASSYVKDYAPDFLATLGDITTGEYTGGLFTITWLSSAPLGATGSGSFNLIAAPPADPTSVSVSFAASLSGVSSIPEPPSAATVAAGLLTLAICGSALRRRSSRAVAKGSNR